MSAAESNACDYGMHLVRPRCCCYKSPAALKRLFGVPARAEHHDISVYREVGMLEDETIATAAFGEPGRAPVSHALFPPDSSAVTAASRPVTSSASAVPRSTAI